MAVAPEDVKQTKKGLGAMDKVSYGINKICFFTISDFVEDRVRIRSLNVVAFSLIYVYFVFALLKTTPAPEPRLQSVRFANPPPTAWVSGDMSADLKNFFIGTGSLPNRSQKLFAVDDSGSPMVNAQVEVRASNFVGDGPLPCSKAQFDAMEGTLEARRLHHVCKYEVAFNRGPTNQMGMTSLTDFSIRGPAGMYTLVPVSDGVAATEGANMLVSTPVASIEVVNLSTPQLELVGPPTFVQVGAPFDWQPTLLLRDMNGLPVPGRRVVAFANPDPSWPPEGAGSRVEPYERRGQKVVELNCPESQPSDARGIATFSCLGVNSTNVDHVSIVFADSALVFAPWNDPVYSPRNLYPLNVEKLRFPTYIFPRVSSVSVTTKVPSNVIEGVPFDPQPVLSARDANGQPVPGVRCYALMSMEGYHQNPNWFRRKLKGIKGKDLLNAEAVTDASGVAEFSGLKLSVAGNTRGLDMVGRWEPASFPYSIDFNCDGTFQDLHAWSNESGGYITEVTTTVSQIRIQRFIRKSAEMARYGIEPAANGTDTFLAVVRVLDAAGNGVAGKTVGVTNIAGNAVVEIAPDALETTNDQGFAVVAFQAIWAAAALKEAGTLQFKVRFMCDGVHSVESEDLTIRVVGKLQPEECHQIVPVRGEIFHLASGTSTLLSGPPPYVLQSGDLFFTTVRLQSQATCAHFPSVSEANASNCVDIISAVAGGRRLQEMDEEAAGRYQEMREEILSSPTRLRELSTPDGHRELSAADGSLRFWAQDAYSNDVDLSGFVRHEPRPMFAIAYMDGAGLPAAPPRTLREYNSHATKFIDFTSKFDAASGDHFVQIAAEITKPDGSVQKCFSEPIPMRVENAVGDIYLEGDGGLGGYYDKAIDAGSYVDIVLRFVLDPSLGDPNDLSRIPSCVHMSDNALGVCNVLFKFVEAPFNFHRPLQMTDIQPDAQPLDTDFYSISPVINATNSTNSDGYDASAGKLHLRFQMKQRGIYGNFGIQFRAFGVNSRVFTWSVRPPAGLRLEMVQDPGFVSMPPWAGNLLDQVPIVRVTSDAGPVNGLILSYDLAPEPGAHFTKLTVLPMYSTFPFLYSAPSGEGVTDAYQTAHPAQDGIAYFPLMGITDGYGCTRMKFVAEGVSTDPVPSDPMCLTAPYFFQIVNQPPSTWPLNLGLNEFGGSITVEVRPIFGTMTQFTQFMGGLLVRLLVSNEGGKDVLDPDTAGDLSQRMLGDSVCVFFGWVEPLQRCSRLELLQMTPYVVLRFSFLRVRWIRRISQPAKIALKVSDLSGSGYRYSVQKPAGFEEMSDVEKFTTCSSAVQETLQDTTASITSEITAETTANQFLIALHPPELITVGSMFLVRLKVTTASGAPVRDVRVRVGIQQAAATSPSSTSPLMLQSLAQNGKRLEVLSDAAVQLDQETTVRISKPSGIVSFPLTITRATSGTYKLLFQPDVPDGRVVLETKPFKVENPIFRIYSTEATWGQVEISDFGQVVTLPRTPKFCVQTATNESLTELRSAGVRISIRLTLKGAPTEQESAATRLARDLKETAKRSMQTSANNMAATLSQESTGFMKEVVDRFIANSASQAKGSFSGLSAEFAEACMATPLRQMQVGDPFTELSFGNLTDAGIAAVQSPSVSEALGVDPSALAPTQILDQFSQVLMSAGATSSSPSAKVAAAHWDFDFDDLDIEADCMYAFKQPPTFSFLENTDYAFTVSVNGVESSSEGFEFKVVRTPPDPVDVAFNWFCSAVAGIVGVIILTTNVTSHHPLWFGFAMLCTIGMLIAAPFLSVHRDALYGAWIYFALVDLVLILLLLVWGIVTETSSTKTFARQRSEIFEAYTKRKLKKALGFEDLRSEKSIRKGFLSSVSRTFCSRFNEEDAFFFPSALVVANLLAFLSFGYIFAQSIQVLWALEEVFNMILNTAMDRSVRLIASVNQAYFELANADLPDSSTEFMYVQIDLMRSWFRQLVEAIIIGFTTGIVVAAILTVLAILGHFVHFRQSVMDARLGKFKFKKSDAKIVFATGFIGISISSAIVSYILIVGLVTLILLPFCFALTWNVIWRALPTIITTFVIPKIISFVSMKVCKKCLFGPTFIKTRAGASIFHFYMTFLALPGGVVSAVMRFVKGLLGVLVMLPITYGANTPDFVNSVTLLDTSYRTYIGYVRLFACHNNPIMITAANRLLEIQKAKNKHKEANKHWTSARSMLLLILLRFPELRKFRKHVLEEDKKVRELLQSKKKQVEQSIEDIEDERDEEDATDVAHAVKVQPQVPFNKRRREPWVENALADAMHAAASANRKVELMKKYAIILAGLEAGSEEHTRVKVALRNLTMARGSKEEPHNAAPGHLFEA